MLYRTKHFKINKIFFIFFIFIMAIAIAAFGIRVTLWKIEEVTDGQAIKLYHQYILGKIFDRNDQLIVAGGDHPGNLYWAIPEELQPAFTNLIGPDIELTMNSKMTVLGLCPWLYGSEDDRLTLDNLLDPSKARIGGNAYLTINIALQEYIYELTNRLECESSTAIVADYTTGEILAVVSTPSFTSEDFLHTDENGVIDDIRGLNQAFSRTFHPGSAIKPILAAIALDIDPSLKDFQYDCCEENHVFSTKEGKQVRINCTENTYHGKVDMSTALACSCNGYFIALLQKLPPEILKEKLVSAGFDTVVDYSGIYTWDATFFGSEPNSEDILFSSIGQGNSYISPIQMNAFTNALLADGTYQEPLLISGKTSSQNTDFIEALHTDQKYCICSIESANIVKEMMLNVTSSGTGEAFYFPDFACKTGTAENENGSNTIWVTGGLINPETPYSITICLDGTTQSSTYAGIVANKILAYLTENNILF